MVKRSIYVDPILDKLRKTLNDEGPSELKGKYYLGDPIVVPKSELPACFISFDKELLRDADNAHLESNMPVVFNIVWDMTRDLNQQLDNIEGHMSIVKLIAGRGTVGSDNYALLPSTMIAVLRKHQDLDTNLWIDVGTDSEVDFGVSVNKRGPGIYTSEGVLRIQVKHHELKPELQQ